MKQLIVAFVCMSALAHVCLAGLTAEEKKELLDEHNRLRRFVAEGKAVDKDGKQLPPAADMTELVRPPAWVAGLNVQVDWTLL